MKLTDNYYRARNGCWIWTGKKLGNKPKRIFYKGKTITPRRAVYIDKRGRIGSYTEVYPSCSNFYCVNPKHMIIRRQENTKKFVIEDSDDEKKLNNLFSSMRLIKEDD